MSVQYLKRPGLYDLAYVHTGGTEQSREPLVVFLGGYRSDMNGTKALYFEAQCKARRQPYLRLDYGGHGQSGGDFDAGTIGDWARDAQDVIRHAAPPAAPLVLVGSSMGGWIAFLVALASKNPIKALIGIAAAPDFTEDLYSRLPNDLKSDLLRQGYALVPNDYSDTPYRFTQLFYEEAKHHLILDRPKDFSFSVTLFQGLEDKDVLPETTDKIRAALPKAAVNIIPIQDGDHRLSRPQDLALIDQEIASVSSG